MGKYGNLIFTGAVVGLVILMVLPIPALLLDFFLALNITLALTILVVSLYLERPLEFTGFPALLLVATLFRLSLNIASTRLILLEAEAGEVIRTFGETVVGGNYVVGAIIFIILVIINFVVITKGSGRIAEVGARFTLDAMPGKQMSIDADLNAGLIDEAGARQRREEVQREADFYGSMDGASKFVRGDAIAGLLITAINIIGGFIIGMTQKGMAAGDSAATFTLLTVGDGLVSQIPALLISTASGIIVSRVAESTDLGSQLIQQLFSSPRVLRMVAGVLFFLGLMGMPKLSFWGIALLLLFLAPRFVQREEEESSSSPGASELEAGAGAPPTPEPMENLLHLDLLELDMGYGLLPLADRSQDGSLLDRIQLLRRQYASDMGLIIPPIQLRDNPELGPGSYRFLIRGVSIAEGDLMFDRELAIESEDQLEKIPGIPTREPAFGNLGVWIGRDQRERAEQLGYYVVDCATVMATHLTELLRRHAHELLGRQELQQLLEICALSSPKVVEELIPDKLNMGALLRVLHNLLKEQVSIRDMRSILEALADHIHLTQSPEILTEFVRQRMAPYLSSQMKSEDGQIRVFVLNPALEEHLRGQMQQMDESFHLSLAPAEAENLLRKIEEQAERCSMLGYLPILMVAPELRRALRNLIEPYMPQIMVSTHKEIRGTRSEVVAQID